MTVKEIIAAAERKGLKYEINTLIENDGCYGLYEIGVNYRDWIWAWFTFTDNTDGYALFRNCYNMATGYETKSRNRGFSIQRQLEK